METWVHIIKLSVIQQLLTKAQSCVSHSPVTYIRTYILLHAFFPGRYLIPVPLSRLSSCRSVRWSSRVSAPRPLSLQLSPSCSTWCPNCRTLSQLHVWRIARKGPLESRYCVFLPWSSEKPRLCYSALGTKKC